MKRFFIFILAVLGLLVIGQNDSKAQGFSITFGGGPGYYGSYYGGYYYPEYYYYPRRYHYRPYYSLASSVAPLAGSRLTVAGGQAEPPRCQAVARNGCGCDSSSEGL